MLTLDPQTIANVLLVAFIAYAGVRFAFRRDTARENRRRAAAQMAQTLSGYGLTQLPKVLTDYSVGDYSGLASSVHDAAKLFLSGEEAVLKEFKEVFERILTKRLATDEGRAYVQARLADATAAARAEAQKK